MVLTPADRQLRESALSTLRTFLSARAASSALSLLDALKLWKGLFYALWMCDRTIPQQNLCADLAGLLEILPTSSSTGGGGEEEEEEKEGVATVTLWLRAFWATMAREWTGIDVYRMEKFLLLVRRMVGASFKWMRAAEGWDARRVDAVLGLLEEWPFSVDDGHLAAGRLTDVLMPKTVPSGLRIHLCDIWVDEAVKVGLLSAGKEEREGDSEMKEADKDLVDKEALRIMKRINTMVETLQQRTSTTAVKLRAKESLADDRLPFNKPGATVGDDDESWDGFD